MLTSVLLNIFVFTKHCSKQKIFKTQEAISRATHPPKQPPTTMSDKETSTLQSYVDKVRNPFPANTK